ncbi:MAG: radical SAM protein [Dysgonamonadaceae bacterium]|nr:radical SAM protein [Dysgonamonadaceae bacterium]
MRDWDEVSKELVASGLVSKEQILNGKIGRKYKSCFALTHELNLYNQYLYPCCIPWPKKPYVLIDSNDCEKAIENYLSLRSSVMEQFNRTGACDDYCNACPFLLEQHWLGAGKIKRITLSGTGFCQFRCAYCKVWHRADEPKSDFPLLIKALKNKKLIDENLSITLAQGEIAVHPQRDAIIEACGKYLTKIFTNAGIYNDKIEGFLKSNNNSSLLVSMDAGTKETFAKIKGRNSYDRVCRNLKRYAQAGGKIELKYILLPGINDNTEDVDGFINLCHEINAMSVILSNETSNFANTWNSPLPFSSIDIARYINENALNQGFAVSLIFFNQADIARIQHRDL